MSRVRLLHLSALVSAALLTSTAGAQYTVGGITFAGADPAQQTALQATAQLSPGKAFTAKDLQNAAQRLSDTGAFDDVQVVLDGPAKSIAVNFTVKPVDASHRLTVSLNNFIWFDPDALTTEIRTRVPLFGPTLPEAGNLIDATQAALEDILKQKNISAKLTHDVVEPSANLPGRAIVFRVTSPEIRLHALHLTGVSSEFAPAIRERAVKVAGRPYTEGIAQQSTLQTLLEPYLNAGYLDAHLADRILTPVSTTPDRIDVDLSGAVQTGVAFHVAQITWAGSPQMSSEAFAAAATLHSGDLASAAALAKTVDVLLAAYHTRGFVDALIATSPVLDESAARVSYSLTATPGAQYRIHTVTPVSLTSAQRADFDRGWLLKPGDLYNPDYVTTFLANNTALVSFNGYAASFKAISDPETHLTDLTITFAPQRH